MWDGFIEQLVRISEILAQKGHKVAHSNSRHSKNPQLEGNKDNVFALGIPKSEMLIVSAYFEVASDTYTATG